MEFCEGAGVVEEEEGAALVSVLLFSDPGAVMEEEAGPEFVSILLDWSETGDVWPAPVGVEFGAVDVSAGAGDGVVAMEFVFAVVSLMDELSLLLLPQPLRARTMAIEIVGNKVDRGNFIFL